MPDTDPRVDAVLDHRWPVSPQSEPHEYDAHRNHQFTAWCAVCKGDVAAILAVADAAVADEPDTGSVFVRVKGGDYSVMPSGRFVRAGRLVPVNEHDGPSHEYDEPFRVTPAMRAARESQDQAAVAAEDARIDAMYREDETDAS